jgi:hypothetical protein
MNKVGVLVVREPDPLMNIRNALASPLRPPVARRPRDDANIMHAHAAVLHEHV